VRSSYAVFTTHFRWSWVGPTAIFISLRETARFGAIHEMMSSENSTSSMRAALRSTRR
jgi:hypothetical protein